MDDFVTPNKFFRYSEFLVSKEYPEIAAGLKLQFVMKDRLRLWVESCGDPWRLAHPDHKIFILSGYRDFALNKLVNGSEDSDHMYACSVDCIQENMDITDFFLSILQMNLPYRQLICYPKRNFVHWSVNIPSRPVKRQTKIVYA